jgi:hypothetical protein
VRSKLLVGDDNLSLEFMTDNARKRKGSRGSLTRGRLGSSVGVAWKTFEWRGGHSSLEPVIGGIGARELR